ncbi:ABC transporter permease [Phormidesmis priestleyi ULC007]|uniref:ABC transporter permease n=1 Tax=Phormidesmis priestleyi ULC007 TaxID=1920490 RepID=A0A2T1DBK5_9CYAN|nr:ABC transporter permease [Phormidesmis priestleyi]PSB17821.1 ABC transporter permease [Phormidesmis priestleyi ULC007]PZO46469.1 MAG: ABC transporter permease [Phormidesmis priestleyi]
MDLSHPAIQRFRKSRFGKIGLCLTIALILLALLAPLLRPYNLAADQSYVTRLMAPSRDHWFGTDGLGRDLLTLVWYGIRTSLLISLASVGFGAIIGLVLGLVAGYFRGWLDTIVGWFTDILLAFPSILLAIVIVTVTSPSVQSVIIAVGIVQIPIYIRLTRSVVFSLREQEFVQAARALGATSLWIILRHILPASLSPLVVQATLSTGTATLEAAGLGFLGLGAQPPTPELGTMLADAFKGGYALSAPWTTVFPGLVITLMVLAFNLLGDGLRDALDTRS